MATSSHPIPSGYCGGSLGQRCLLWVATSTSTSVGRDSAFEGEVVSCEGDRRV